MIIYQKTIFCILLSTFCFLLSGSAFGAEIFLHSEIEEIKIGEQFEASILLNTEKEYINAVEGKIIFPRDLLELKEIRDGNSVINFWIERPNALQEEIVFSGIVPGGYIGENGLIFSAIFLSTNEGQGIIEIHQAKTLLNDGTGAEANLTISNLPFLVSKQALPQVPPMEIIDTDPPEPFEPIIAQDSSIFGGKYFLVFATQDKGSGISHYEIREGKRNFVIAESPYLLQNQDLDQEIIVKAIDKNNNETIAVLLEQPLRPWYKNYYIFAILIIGAMFAFLIWKILWRKRKQI